MLRLVFSVALVLSLLGCYAGGASAPPGESLRGLAAPSAPPSGPVRLLTGSLGCYAGGEGPGATAPLVVDATYGTSFLGRPVMWPTGYTARRAGFEVEVLNTQGKVIATTGRTYNIAHAYAPDLVPNDDGSFGGTPPPPSAFPAAVECTYEFDFVDCTANPTDVYCQPREPQHGPSPTPPQPPQPPQPPP
jgi:hypothetical protein